MADPDSAEEKPKKSKLPLILGLVLAVVGGAGGFWVVQSGLLEGGNEEAGGTHEVHVSELPDFVYVELKPLVISLHEGGEDRHLKFQAEIETKAVFKGDVEKLRPRIVDVLNTYLRAVKLKDIRAPSALVRLRGQMLRRIQMVVGEGRVNDLLIQEMVLN